MQLLYLCLEHKKYRPWDVLTQMRPKEISTVLQTYNLNTIFVGLRNVKFQYHAFGSEKKYQSMMTSFSDIMSLCGGPVYSG